MHVHQLLSLGEAVQAVARMDLVTPHRLTDISVCYTPSALGNCSYFRACSRFHTVIYVKVHNLRRVCV